MSDLQDQKQKTLLDGGCRLALAAFLHDLGKLAQRARLFDNDPRRELHRQLYCPQWHRGTPQAYFTHYHAADTALALDLLERHLPELRGSDPFPFASIGATDQTDSLINAAAAHHRPETFLQWMVAKGDRISSGFEREKFEQGYNQAKERNSFIREQLLVRFEEYAGPEEDIRRKQENELCWRYPLQPLSPAALTPERAAIESRDESAAVAEYLALWNLLLPTDGGNGGVGLIPKSHRQSWPLWLDHFDTLWLTAAHAIPSATAFGARPDVSLYDHSKSTAAFTVALWRYYHDRKADEAETVARLRARQAENEQPFLLVQGDFSGIQNFIFGGNAVVQKKAARLLRGRSALVGLLAELAALRLLDAMALPPTSLVINAAGKFLIVAPNSAMANDAIAMVRSEIDGWFVDSLFGLAGIGIAATPLSEEDFTANNRFMDVQRRLWQELDVAKRQAFGLCGANPPSPLGNGDYRSGVCRFDSRLPASEGMEVDGEPAHPVSKAAIELGAALADRSKGRLLVFRTGSVPKGLEALPLDIFGYQVAVTRDRDESGNFGEQAQNGALVRAFDTSLVDGDVNAVAWHGYARRSLSAYTATHRHDPQQDPRYKRISEEAIGKKGDIKSFEHLALVDQTGDDDETLCGVEAIGVLKGDIDDLGEMFRKTLADKPTFARWAELSRRINSFFTVTVPALCEREEAFRDLYTVYAGGDDFFFVGPWWTLRKFAYRLQQEFNLYVARNARIHFSAGYVMAKPGFPVRQLATEAEKALQRAKGQENTADKLAKNAFALHGATISWSDWPIVEELIEAVGRHTGTDELSAKFVYGLLQLIHMREGLIQREGGKKPENARWRSRLHYQARRFFEKPEIPAEKRETRAQELIVDIGERGITQNPDALRIALIEQIYRQRG